MSNQREITEQLDALSIYHFLLDYTTLEEMIKELYVQKWPDFTNEVQQRLMFYQGGLNMQKSFIEYDTYSVVTQHHKFDVKTMLNNLTLNQMIKVERKENQIPELRFNIQSLQNRMTVYPCIDCILNLLNMRNILAHKMNDLSFKNKEYIDVLKNEIIWKSNIRWLEMYDLNLLSESARCIVSNYIYMNIIYKKLRSGRDDKTMDN